MASATTPAPTIAVSASPMRRLHAVHCLVSVQISGRYTVMEDISVKLAISSEYGSGRLPYIAAATN